MYQPSKKNLMSIKQMFSLSDGRLRDLIRNYNLEIVDSGSDASFLNYCLENEKGLVKPMVPLDWSPFDSTVEFLSSDIHNEYLNEFLLRYGGKPAPAGDLNSLFSEFCRSQWQFDCRNQNATGVTFMKMGWEPDDRIYAMILGDIHEINFTICEFKLYWFEVRGFSKNWNRKLFLHLKGRGFIKGEEGPFFE